ncbi:UBC-like protein, partial [Violaceomyces palustris]
NCPSGIYVLPDKHDTHLWHCVTFIRKGPYTGGIFRFDIVFPVNFPAATPQVYFPPTLLHPLVDPNTGRMLLTSRFTNGWKPRETFVTHLLYFVKAAFQDDTIDGLREGLVANLEVYKMYRDNKPLFKKLAHQSVSLSTSPSSLYDISGGSGFPSPSIGADKGARNEEAAGIHFSKVDEDEMAALRREIFGDEE